LEVEGVVVEFMEGIPWQSLWIFVSINCSSQIHNWICVKFKSILVWKVSKALLKFQHHRGCCKGATLVGSRGGWIVYFFLNLSKWFLVPRLNFW
jgi:hypothetical protein